MFDADTASLDRLLDLHQEYMRRLSVGAVGAWLQLDLTLPQLRLLYLLAREGSATPGALARTLRLAPSTVTGLLDRLDERGLVRRDDDPSSRRCVVASATEAGAALIDDLVASRREQLSALFARLSEEERARITEAFRLLVAVADPPAATAAGAGAAAAGPRNA
jgi:DNA-binding MarR family transcriptional regulator